jgi:hypothetical protein
LHLFENNIFTSLKTIYVRDQKEILSSHKTILDSLKKMLENLPDNVYSNVDKYKINIFGETDLLQSDEVIKFSKISCLDEIHHCDIVVILQ